jgi:dephospho-CoA kinase
MWVLGLTGSIGMGKSTAASMLRRMGVFTHESDHAVHQALAPGGSTFEEVAVTFPDAWDKKTHTINRQILGKIIFENPGARQELEKILHPVARQAQEKFIRHHHRLGQKHVCLDIPLLFETGAENRVDAVIVVTAPFDIQRRRVLARPGMTEDKFLAILNAQMPDAEKQARADFVVSSGLGYAHLYHSLHQVIQMIKGMAYA